MARFGKTPVILPKSVEVKATGQEILVKGPKGELKCELPKGMSVKMEEGMLQVEVAEGVKLPKAFHGLYRSMINNMVIGVSSGFEKKLSLVGVGFRAATSGHKIDLQIGFSHPTSFEVPKGIQVAVDKEKGVDITITGVDKQLVGEFAAKIRAIKKPEPYKGKGIRYKDEYVRKKAGKAAATTSAAK